MRVPMTHYMWALIQSHPKHLQNVCVPAPYNRLTPFFNILPLHQLLLLDLAAPFQFLFVLPLVFFDLLKLPFLMLTLLVNLLVASISVFCR